MKYLYFIFLLLMVSCGGGDDDSSEGRSIITGKYSDGTYCADVTYHNSNTGTTNTYTLNVEVEDNELTTIYWGNGGWLDGSHFSPEELDSHGYCSFTSDKGYDYEVQINGSECSTTDESRVSSENEEETDSDEEDKKETCIRCGNEVYNSRMYCKKCIDEDENTCSKCGGFEYYVYRGKCSSCKRREREEEDEERRREEEEEERRKEENN